MITTEHTKRKAPFASNAKQLRIQHISLRKDRSYFTLRQTFLFRPPVSSRALGRGARRGAACARRCKCGCRPRSMARAPGVQSREIWQVTTGSLFAELEPSKKTENPHIIKIIFLFCALLLYLLQIPHQPSKRVYFDAATVRQQPRFKLFPLRQPYSKQYFCAGVSVWVCAIEPRILQQAVGTSVPGSTVTGTHQRAVQLLIIHFFTVLSAAVVYVYQFMSKRFIRRGSHSSRTSSPDLLDVLLCTLLRTVLLCVHACACVCVPS